MCHRLPPHQGNLFRKEILTELKHLLQRVSAAPPFMVKPMGRRYERGQTVGKENSSGTMRIFQADSPDGIKVSIGYIEWMNGEKEVKYFDAENNKALIQNCGRLRLGIHECGPGYERVILNQARTVRKFGERGKPTAKKASQDELDQGAGFDTFSLLKKLGAVEIAKREKLLNDLSAKNKNVAHSKRKDLSG